MASNTRRLLAIVEITIVLALLIAVYSRDLSDVPFHRDESLWIASSNMAEAFAEGNFRSPVWEASYWTVTQPPTARYVIGLSRRVGGFHAEELNQPYDFSHDLRYNVQNHLVPARGLLWWSRFGMALLAAASMLIGFVFLLKGWGRRAAYPWLLLCCTSAYFLLHLRRAMGESPLLFFVALSMVCGFLALSSAERGSAKRSLVWFSLMGVCVGLAASSKLNGGSVIMAAAALAILAAFRLFHTRKERLRYGAKALLILGFVSGLTFTVVYPFLWPDPPYRAAMMVRQRIAEMRSQQRGHPDDALYDSQQRVEFLATFAVANTVSTRFVGWPGTLVLGVLGFGAAISAAMKWIRARSNGPVAVVLLAVGVAASAPVAGTLLRWDRYELFPVFTMSLLVSIGAGLALGWLTRVATKNLAPRKAIQGR